MKFKESSLVKNHKILTGTKRDMRKKVVKSTTPTSDLKKPTTLKRQLGGNIFTTYNSIAPYEGPVFEQPVATVEIKELPISRLETNRQNVMAKVEEKKEEPVVEEKVNTEPLPTSKEETPVVENKESAPINIKSKDEFIKTMTPAFENALKARGLDTKYAKYLVAQSALESNWGKSQSGKFNFGGIKGKGTTRRTREVVNGKSIYINDSFRDFKDINDYANYHVSLLNNKRYQAFSGGDFIDSVVKGGYATDPNYKKALSNVYNQIAKAQVGMKIPKLQNAGELRARILRRFRQEKSDAHNEELIGFDWSRYKSNKPKPETTPTQSEQLENGGVIKAQDGIVTQTINKVKSFLPKEEPKEPINVVDVAKEYAPSAVASMLLGNINPIIGQILGLNQNIDLTKAPPSLEKVNTNMWKFENPKNKGLRGNLYYPFKTANGNTDIGPGYDLDMQTAEFKKKAANGMTKEELDAIMLERLRKEIPHLDAKLNSVTNNNADTISPQIKEGLLDMYWQLKNGLYDYDNLFEGIAKGDIDKIREESKVTYKSKNTGKRYFDSGRYKHRIDNYFHY
jgi:flagellum-specific peptidoglycan hydrolase FlgJ